MAANAAGIRAGQAYVELGVKDGLAAGLRQAQARVKSFANSLTQTGLALAGAGVAGGMAFAPVLQQFATFEYAMARVGAISNATADDFGALTREAMRLGAETQFTATDAAKAMGYFALAGYDAAKTLKVIGPTLDMAAAGQMDMALAADITTKVLAGMGLEAGKAAYAVDVLTKAMTTANTDLPMLGDAFKYVGPAAKAAKLAFEEVTAAIQILSNAGMQGDMAGTSLRQIIASLTAPSAEGAAELKRLGVAVKDAAGNFRPLADIIADFQKGLAGKGSADLLNSINQIFTARSATAAVELIGQGAGKLREMTDALKDSGGTAKRVADAQMNTLMGSWLQLTSALEGTAIVIGKTLAPLFRDMATVGSVVAGVLSSLTEENAALLSGLVKAATVGAALTAGLLALGLGLKGVILAAGAAVVLAKVAAVAGAVAAAVSLLSEAGVSLRGGLGAVVGWLGDRFAWLADRTSETLDLIRLAASNGDLDAAWKALATSLQLTWLEATEGIRTAWRDLVDATVDEVTWLGDVWEDFTALFGASMDKVDGRLKENQKNVATWGESWEYFVNGLNDDMRKLLGSSWDSTEWKLGGPGAEEAEAEARAEAERKNPRLKERRERDEARAAERERRREEARAEKDRLRAGLDRLKAEQWKKANWQGPSREELERGQWIEDHVFGPPRPEGGAQVPTPREVLDSGKGSVMGTFNLAAVAGFGVEAALAKVAENTRATADGVKRLVDEARNGGGWFV